MGGAQFWLRTRFGFQIDGGVVVEVSSWDDVSLHTEYRAPGLAFHSGRIGVPTENDDELAWFRGKVQSWLATGCDEELMWTVQVQVSLTSSPTSSLIPPATGGGITG